MKTGDWLTLTGLLYLASLPLPAFRNEPSPVLGIHCLILIPFVFMYAAWWANLCWFAGCICLSMDKPGWAIGLGALASTLAVSVFRYPDPHLGPGYYAWLASLLTLTVAGCRGRGRSPKPSRPLGVEDF